MAGDNTLDRLRLERHLRHNGFAAALAGLLGAWVDGRAFFVRPEAAPDLALRREVPGRRRRRS